MRAHKPSVLTRRDFLETAAVGGAGWLLAATAGVGQRDAAGAASSVPDPAYYGGFKMAIQSYSLRTYPVDVALEKTRQLGLKYWESFDRHLPMTSDAARIAEYKGKLGSNGIELLAYGVVRFGADGAARRRVFEFAKAVGLHSISADPEPAALDNLDKLVEEYGIAIAIHNHGPRARYDKIDDCLRAMKDHHRLIGACVDTGHYLRSNEDPVAAVKAFGTRTYGVHVKDVKTTPAGKKQFCVLGEGDLKLVDLLKLLRQLSFQGALSLEYEESEKNPMPDIEQCLRVMRAGVAKLATA